jgi:hypothetical protein
MKRNSERTNILLFFEEEISQLIGQDIPLPGIPLGQTFPQRKFTLPAKITVGGIKIVESGL